MPRLIPLTPVLARATRRGRFRVRSRLRDAAAHVVAVDVYSHLRESHPETHLGYWVFPLPEGEAAATCGVDFTVIGPESVWIEGAQGRQAAVDSWSNPA